MASSRKTPSKDLAARVGATLAPRLAPGDTLTLGLSGGRDSVVLLDLLAVLRGALGFRLDCVHVHHGLSPHADAWAAFCAARCAGLGVALTIENVVIEPHDARGVEAAARAARQRVFERVLNENQRGWIVTAHHQNDQAETLLLQLLRGAGPRGLAAMPLARDRQLRPLLDVTRDAIIAHAAARGLTWVEDESNQDPRYRRNALRHLIVPVLDRHFPQAQAALARAASLQAEAADLLEQLAVIDAAVPPDSASLSCGKLAALSPARARNVLRHFIAHRGGRMPHAAQLDEALAQLLGTRDDGKVALALGDGTLWRYRGDAYWLPHLPGWDGELSLPSVSLSADPMPRAPVTLKLGESGVELRLAACVGAGLCPRKLAGAVVRFRRGGEIIRLHRAGPHRRLKTLYQERGIAPWQRARLPLVFVGETLVWAAGVGSDPEYSGTLHATALGLDWHDSLTRRSDGAVGSA